MIALATTSLTSPARADAPPPTLATWLAIPGLPAVSLPGTLPSLPPVPPLQGWSTGAAGLPTLDPATWSRVLTEAQRCQPIEVAPGVRIPVPCTKSGPVDPGRSARKHYSPFPLPPRVSLAAWGLESPVRDQQQTGACWAFALAGASESALRRTGNTDLLSPMHLVSTYSQDHDAFHRPTGPRKAIASESAWPYDPVRACVLNDVTSHDVACESAYRVPAGSWRSSPQMRAEVARADTMGRYVVTREYLSAEPDELATVLAEGRAVVLSIGIDSQAWDWHGAQRGTLPEYAVADRGGHDVLLTGYVTTPTGRFFRVKNSWGTQWGEAGSVWISEPSLRRHFQGASIVTAVMVR